MSTHDDDSTTTSPQRPHEPPPQRLRRPTNQGLGTLDHPLVTLAGVPIAASNDVCAYAAGCPTPPLTQWIAIAVVGILVAAFVLPFIRARLPWGRRDWRPSDAKGNRERRSRSDIPSPSVRLADVAGCDEAKGELAETIEFLRSPGRFHELGARIPHGVLLFGPPGTGKTMLAKAVATEAGVPFLYASGSEFVEKWVGVGARRIRDLFARARSQGRCVVFIDEFDAIARARGGPNANEEREQSLNQLLVELDGFSTSDDTVVVAATNRLDVLDPAVLRPGRFSRKIHVGLPDRDGRLAILEVHARTKPIGNEVDLAGLARKTYGFSGADLADLLNEAAISAARRRSRTITADDVQAGWLKVAVGTSRRRSMNEREREIIAAHEIGHALCGRVLGDNRRVEEISLYAHGEALGVTVTSEEDNFLPSESDLRARLVALMGGRAAEELLFDEVTGGASNDLQKANEIAMAMITRWGMGKDPATDPGGSGRGALSFVVGDIGSMPGEFGSAAQRAISAILDEAYQTAKQTLIDEMDRLLAISEYLVEHERMDGATFEALFEDLSARSRSVPAVAGVGLIADPLAVAATTVDVLVPKASRLRAPIESKKSRREPNDARDPLRRRQLRLPTRGDVPGLIGGARPRERLRELLRPVRALGGVVQAVRVAAPRERPAPDEALIVSDKPEEGRLRVIRKRLRRGQPSDEGGASA